MQKASDVALHPFVAFGFEQFNLFAGEMSA